MVRNPPRKPGREMGDSLSHCSASRSRQKASGHDERTTHPDQYGTKTVLGHAKCGHVMGCEDNVVACLLQHAPSAADHRPVAVRRYLRDVLDDDSVWADRHSYLCKGQKQGVPLVTFPLCITMGREALTGSTADKHERSVGRRAPGRQGRKL